MSKCTWITFPDCITGGSLISCKNEATHIDTCEFNNEVCKEHACRRHGITFDEYARREELKIIPSHWMAL